MKKGFSKVILIIFVISILVGAITIFSYSSKKSAGNDAKNKIELNRAATIAKTCLRKGGVASTPAAGQKICNTGTQVWPELSNGWQYSASSSLKLNNFSLAIEGNGSTFKCDLKKCQ